MLLGNLVKALGEEFGLLQIAKEANVQYKIALICAAVTSYPDSKYNKKPRIRAAKILFGLEHGEATEWIESRFEDNGNGCPIY